MKLHILAEELKRVSRLPNISKDTSKAINDLANAFSFFDDLDHKALLKKIELLSSAETDQGMATNIVTLYAMSQIGKQQWINFTKRNEFNIDLNPRDSARDMIGKILKHLAENPLALKKIKKQVAKKEKNKSDSDQTDNIDDMIHKLLKI